MVDSAPSGGELAAELRGQGYAVSAVRTGTEASHAHLGADLVLLNLELPDVDGLEICRAIRSAGDTPVIAIAGRDAELDRVLALQAGADDCVVRTCGFGEVSARIEAVLRRAKPRAPEVPEQISLCPLHIDLRARRVSLDRAPVAVTSKEFDLLSALAANPEAVLSRKELMARIWDDNWAETSRTIDTHVSSLRAKLGSANWIRTVRGVGYRIGRPHGAEWPEEHDTP
ncbi:DNA-binding response regulator, OmpR family, contains REC and winged-helix (wHTH) domain [Actinosynnema pretiosum]|nr:DNA-binding response regulator, OmpR family, contains REC and winged-helix (wHTH) domain [Actinosynnema pretiosum]